MTSEKREWYEGATYHILQQGDIIEMIYLEMKIIRRFERFPVAESISTMTNRTNTSP